MDYKLFWTEEAIDNLENILDYLINNWSEKEVIEFKKKLSRQIKLILNNPFMCPVSEYNPRLRRSFLSKQTTIFYELENNIIYIVHVFVNYQDIKKIE
jgi:plasmid stabilization system protein ParE